MQPVSKLQDVLGSASSLKYESGSSRDSSITVGGSGFSSEISQPSGRSRNVQLSSSKFCITESRAAMLPGMPRRPLKEAMTSDRWSTTPSRSDYSIQK